MSARRKGEIESLQAGCATRDAFGEWWLSTYIEKTIRDLDQVPIPASVARAVSLLERLSAAGRKRTGMPWLITIDSAYAAAAGESKQSGHDVRLGRYINRFAEIADILSPTGTEDWTFASHQLRRAFSIYYYQGNRYRDFDALNRFLRHFDPEVTRIYIT
jgi:integrase